MIDDRDKLLRYLSHDLKKPVTRIGQAALALEGTEPDPVRRSTLREIADKAEGIRAGLTDLQHYARRTMPRRQAAPSTSPRSCARSEARSRPTARQTASF